MLFKRSLSSSVIMMLTAVLALAIPATAVVAQRVVRKNVVPTPLTVSLTSSTSTISSCASDPSASRIQLKAATNVSASRVAKYRWSATAGHVEGDGPSVVWDLAGVQPGYYKASLIVTTGDIGDECEAFSSIPVLVSRCALPAPVCPNISISCPDNVLVDQPIRFSANITGVTAGSTPTYYWMVSGGRIIEGQGTTSILVDTAGLGGQSVTATVAVQGYTIDCSASCAISIPLAVPPSKRFDEFPNIPRNDEKARLDNLAIALQNDPTATAYVIVYPSRNGAADEAQKRTKRIVDYLVNSRAIDERRISTLTGSARNSLRIELWITPQGAKPPVPSP
jgi:hypothetical protein